MLRPSVIRRVVVAAVTVTALIVSPMPAWAAPAAAQLNAADLTLLNGVHQAALWETPAGQLAAQKGGSTKVRQVGQAIADQDVQLDRLVVDAAEKLGVTIPATATTAQQGWLTQLQNAEGDQFDQTFVTLLRAADGTIFPAVGAVRTSTRNPLIRQLADQADTVVMRHMQILESTGLVQYQKLPPGAMPAAQDLSTLGMAEANNGLTPPVSSTVLYLLLGAAVAASGVTFLRARRGRHNPDPRPRGA